MHKNSGSLTETNEEFVRAVWQLAEDWASQDRITVANLYEKGNAHVRELIERAVLLRKDPPDEQLTEQEAIIAEFRPVIKQQFAAILALNQQRQSRPDLQYKATLKILTELRSEEYSFDFLLKSMVVVRMENFPDQNKSSFL